jgi:hypothetical protein
MHEVKLWSHPSNYAGATWGGWYSAGFGQSRDSDALETSNFLTVYNELRKLSTECVDADGDEMESIQRVYEGHWAVGWVEWIAIHSTNTVALEKARELCKHANDYPILDEDDFSRRENEDCEQIWRECYSASERIEYLRKHSYTAQSFSDLLQAIRAGSWYHAANMLHCPSDLLY